ncbi:MAG: bifunctional UDP-N-acetylmuramoyl-tripeptide:D-alanyl-D-alanine ligase/alanine racemase, partial [Bacteroidetes bacterium]
MAYTIEHIHRITQARWLRKVAPQAAIEQLLLDSRTVTAPAHALFFALTGERHDGHRFLGACYAAGVRHFVVSRDIDTADLPEANILQVADTLEALQQLAAYHRARFALPVIGITGSNGKTIVKEWLAQLAHQFQVVRSPKSYNSQVGVPLSVWQIRPEHTLGIFEAGISRTGEMERLARIIRPNIGVLTNIGPAHREGFPSDAVKLSEKMRLFDSASTLVVCADQETVATAAQRWAQEKPGRQLYDWSLDDRPARLQIRQIQASDTAHTRLKC